MGFSHSAYLLRSACSATLSAIVGIMCKVITVIINTLMWDKHASHEEFAFLALGLVCGLFYRQAPMRSAQIDCKVSAIGEDCDGEANESESR